MLQRNEHMKTRQEKIMKQHIQIRIHAQAHLLMTVLKESLRIPFMCIVTPYNRISVYASDTSDLTSEATQIPIVHINRDMNALPLRNGDLLQHFPIAGRNRL